jgi:poly-gamma-glutamate synthesis protein (capsule biosynthesis protein)
LSEPMFKIICITASLIAISLIIILASPVSLQIGFRPLHSVSPPDFSTQTRPQPKMFTLLATGDVMLGRTLNDYALSRNDFTFAFADTASILSSADLTLINLETPLSSTCPPSKHNTVFCADLRHLAGLAVAGVDIVSLANNHVFDQGETTFASASAILEKAGMKVIYAGHPAKLSYNGLKISFHAFNDIWSFSKKYSRINPEEMQNEISAAATDSDLIIVMFHWGNEYTEYITDRQKTLARLAIDSGADLIIGSHPHWIQTSETYSGKKIDYSLGNYIFDQYWSEKTRYGLAALYRFSNSVLTAAEYTRVYQKSDGHTILDPLQ